MELSLAGKRVLVSGGTRGIGRAVVQAFAEEGAHIGFCARTASEVQLTQEQVAATAAGRIAGSVVDVTHQGALARWVSESAVLFDGLDIVVSSAAAMVLDDTDENWSLTLQVDLLGTVRSSVMWWDWRTGSRARESVPTRSVPGTPGEVADAVVFIASPRASRVTGANILVDGGLSRGIQL